MYAIRSYYDGLVDKNDIGTALRLLTMVLAGNRAAHRIRGRPDIVAEIFEEHLHALPNRLFVVDNEDSDWLFRLRHRASQSPPPEWIRILCP